MTETVDCDVLVAGSGAGGLAAAITARTLGTEVVVAEKTAVFGGTTAFLAGMISILCNHLQASHGIADSPEAALTYLEHEVGNRLDRAKAEAFIAEGPGMVRFLEANSHVRYRLQPGWADYHPNLPGGLDGGRSLLPEQFDGRRLGDDFARRRAPIETMMILGGMTVGRDDLPHLLTMTRSVRSAWTVARLLARHAADRLRFPRGTRIANGNALVARMALTLKEKGVPIWLDSPVEALLSEDGHVTGARLRRKGQAVRVRARQGVILACGGFPGDQALKARHYPHLAAGNSHRSLPPATNSGDGIRLGESVGGRFLATARHAAAWTPVSLVPRGGATVPFPHFVDRGKPG